MLPGIEADHRQEGPQEPAQGSEAPAASQQ
jgi:hypothetical protein